MRVGAGDLTTAFDFAHEMRQRRTDMTASVRRGLVRRPRGVWALGLVSMCMDLSSQPIHSLPLYMAVGLGVSTFVIGIVEGGAEAWR